MTRQSSQIFKVYKEYQDGIVRPFGETRAVSAAQAANNKRHKHFPGVPMELIQECFGFEIVAAAFGSEEAKALDRRVRGLREAPRQTMVVGQPSFF